jgi:hypothetical protein
MSVARTAAVGMIPAFRDVSVPVGFQAQIVIRKSD